MAAGETLVVTLLVMVAGGRAQEKTPSYSVVAPNTIRPNTDYYAAITMDGIEGDLQVRHHMARGHTGRRQPF